MNSGSIVGQRLSTAVALGISLLLSHSFAQAPVLQYSGVLRDEQLVDGVAGQMVESPDGEHIYGKGFQDIYLFGRSGETGRLQVKDTTSQGEEGVVSMEGIADLIVTPDGKNVYAVCGRPPSNGAIFGYYDQSLAMFSRDPVSGELTYMDTLVNGVNGIDGLADARAIVVSPDGFYVYTAAASEDEIGIFSRSTEDGSLTFVKVVQNNSNGVIGLDGVYHLEISSDGTRVYAGSFYENAVVSFARNSVTGDLTYLDSMFGNTTATNSLGAVSGLRLSPDETQLFVPTNVQVSENNTINGRPLSILNMDPLTGELSYSGGLLPDGIRRIFDVTFSVDGEFIYANAEVDAFVDEGLALFSRNTLSGAIQFLNYTTLSDEVGGGVLLSSDNQYLYISTYPSDGDFLNVYKRNISTGSLSSVESLKRGAKAVDGMDSPWRLVVSPDSKHIYCTGFFDLALTVFEQDSVTRNLRRVETLLGSIFPGEGTPGLYHVTSVALSPDGKHVYTVSEEDGLISIFLRDSQTGKLTHLGKGIPGDIVGHYGTDVVVSPDGAHVYATADDSIFVFTRDSSTGLLSQTQQIQDSFYDSNSPADYLTSSSSVRVSPDGNYVYVGARTNAGFDAITVFSRNQSTGQLQVEQEIYDGLTGIVGLGAVSLDISPDGDHLYSVGGDSICFFSRNVSTGQLTQEQVLSDGSSGGDALQGTANVAISPDGRHVFVTARSDDGLTVFRRNTQIGELTFEENLVDETNGVDGLWQPIGVAVSPNGAYVYVSGWFDHSLSSFARDTDQDYILDADEADAGTDRLNPDSDNDGILDGVELAANLDPTSGTIGADDDPDNDGLTIAEEIDLIGQIPVDLFGSDLPHQQWFVSAVNGNDSRSAARGGGTREYPWQTIGKAMEELAPLSRPNFRPTVLLDDTPNAFEQFLGDFALYEETVTLIPYVVLREEDLTDGLNVHIRPDTFDITPVIVGAEGATLRDVWIRPTSGARSLLLIDNVSMTVSGVLFDGQGIPNTIGIEVLNPNSSDSLLRSNYLINLGIGILARDTSAALSDNTFDAITASEGDSRAILVRLTLVPGVDTLAPILGSADRIFQTGFNRFRDIYSGALAVQFDRVPSQVAAAEFNDWGVYSVNEINNLIGIPGLKQASDAVDIFPFVPEDKQFAPGTITGVILDSSTKLGIPLISEPTAVLVGQASTFADSDGLFSFNVSGGVHMLYGDAHGYTASIALPVSVTQGSVEFAPRILLSGTPVQPGSLRVTIEPSAARTAGARWRVNGGPLQLSGATVSGLAPGSANVSFTTIDGWMTPQPVDVNIVAGETTPLARTYQAVTGNGTLRVTIEPSGARSAGARWRINGGSTRTSGESVSLPPGSYSVSFTNVSGWQSPNSYNVQVNSDQPTSRTSTYTPLQSDGAIRIDISPPEAVAAGAQWRIDNGLFRSSGESVPVPPGAYTVSFSSVPGRNTPSARELPVTAGQTTQNSATYVCRSLVAPTNLSATDGTLNDRVRVTWNSVPGATRYTVYRSTNTDFGQAIRLGSVTGTLFDDFNANKEIAALMLPPGQINPGRNRTVPASLVIAVLLTMIVMNLSSRTPTVRYRFRPHGVGTYAVLFLVACMFVGCPPAPPDPPDPTDPPTPPAPETTIYHYWVQAENGCGVSPPSNSDAGNT